MNKEFHYDITYLVARRAGFSPEESFLIAYASQYTDDNTEPIYINTGIPGEYTNVITQTIDLRKFLDELLRIFCVFHFLPGSAGEQSVDSARRTDGTTHPLNTIPDNLNANNAMSEAFKAHNPYLIGIATHVYADTFAHQNFVGIYTRFNSKAGIMPSIGHLDVGHNPDIPNNRWDDSRLISDHHSIDNKGRFLDAAAHIFDLYSTYLGTRNGKNALLADLSEAIVDNEDDREKNYRSLIGKEYVEYDRNAWFAAATDFTVISTPGADTAPSVVSDYIWKDNYKNSDWFQFQEAAKSYQAYVVKNILGPIY